MYSTVSRIYAGATRSPRPCSGFHSTESTTGHGGSATAEYLKENLPGRVLDEIPPEVKSGLAAEQFASLFERFDEEMLSDFRKDFKSLLRVPGEALRRWRIGNKLSDGEVLARAQRVKSGSTALIAYVEGSRLFVANAGDCRAGEL